MRISDWSSDVCSSDLEHDHVVGVFGREAIAVETVGGVIDLEAAAFQVLAHHFRDVAVVLDDEAEATWFRCSPHTFTCSGNCSLQCWLQLCEGCRFPVHGAVKVAVGPFRSDLRYGRAPGQAPPP